MIITTPYGSFVIRKVMDGFDEMSKYISEYVDDSKKTYK